MRLIHIRFILIPAVLLMVLHTPAPAQTPDSPVQLTSSLKASGQLGLSLRQEASASMKRGLDWLAALQRPDGSWSDTNFPALTALAIWPFIQSDYPGKEDRINRAVSFLRSFVQPDGGIYRPVPNRKGGGLSNYNTAICMTVLHATGRKDLVEVIQKARTFIAGNQHFGDDEYRGGFGYDRQTQRAYTDLLNTYYSAEAMRVTQDVEDLRPAGDAKVDINWAETVKYIERLQNKPAAGTNEAGGFVYNPADPKAGTVTNQQGVVVFRSYGSITYAGLLALIYAQVNRDDVRIRSALDWAGRHWSLDENPGMGQDGLFFFFNVLSKALNAAGQDFIPRPSGEPVDWRADLTRKLIALQKIEPETGAGYWINDINRYWEGDKVLVTAYTLRALQMVVP
ncbi:MAG: hypothetical protein A2498_13220 [Lentisphaerae bacterium RIFOXYC12_FULL_60_16]|nr:MAG: hypothetical protein A2498_13220 [Lentisphaerae bacterium RIFOXYC12_FULL_60_16]